MGARDISQTPVDPAAFPHGAGVREGWADAKPCRLQGCYLDDFEHGPRFAVWWLPIEGTPRGSVVVAQPLGEERNLARRVLAAQAHRLAARGWAVLMIDLFGTGDSPGNAADATLPLWRSDLLRAAMLARRHSEGPNVLWGVRDGALLTADIAVALDQLVDAYVFWQAPERGDNIVASMRVDGERLSPAMLDELRQLRMQPPPTAEHGVQPSVMFLEIRPQQPPGAAQVSSLTCSLTENWLEAGYLASPRAVTGRQFWRNARLPLPAAAFKATEEFLENLQ
ncbi:MAG: hypothetical protein J0H09_24745 [Burkholderiales bacterium]|nr:hypothetical protein [Burkholderiales bacterium]